MKELDIYFFLCMYKDEFHDLDVYMYTYFSCT